jgi:hypothetical protein
MAVSSTFRTISYGQSLDVIGRDRTVVSLGIDVLPTSFGPVLQKVFLERAPQAKGGRTSPAGWPARGRALNPALAR